MHKKVLGIKQRTDNQKFVSVYKNIEQYVSKKHLDNLIDDTLLEIKRTVHNKRVGYAWSGGKDSIALEFLMQESNIERCVIGLTYDLEYPAHLRFVTDYMPNGLEVFNSGLSLDWLSSNLQFLFPQNSNVAGQWFKKIQHKAQDWFYKKHNLQMICLGRRKLDCNYIGKKKGQKVYANKKGIVRYSPIANWTHEETLALIHYYNLSHSPLYSWVNGYVVGTGSWAARQWTGSITSAWSELWQIDEEIVKFASSKIQSAKEFINQNT